MSGQLRLERRALGDLVPSAFNPRRHDERQIAKIAASIREFGWRSPILVDESGEIVCGEARWRAAGLVGLESVTVLVAEGMTDLQRRAYRIADNRLAELATWDEELLAEVLLEIDAQGLALDPIGFDETEIERMIAGLAGPPPANADEAHAPPVEPVTRPGDLWLLGQHRLICADATRPESYARLLSGDRAANLTLAAEDTADLLFTDPPYGMSYVSKTHGGLLGDDARGAALVALVRDALKAARANCRPSAASYVCLTWRTWGEFLRACDDIGLRLSACIVWDKGSIGLGSMHYRPRHEFIFYGAGGAWHGGRSEEDVWQFARPAAGDYVHPTQKPVALIERALRNSTQRGEVVLDCFGGSGSTLIAAERLGRRARVLELDPKFCDAIVRR